MGFAVSHSSTPSHSTRTTSRIRKVLLLFERKAVKYTLACLLFFLLATPSWAKWSTYKFEVIEGYPDVDNKLPIDYLPESSGLDKLELIAIEDYMSRVAQTLDDFGFPEPNISTRSSNGAFIIYLANTGNQGVYSDSRAHTIQTLIMNPHHELNHKGDKLTVRGWHTLAHELFHAIQDGCAYAKNPAAHNLWISEGTADAIGYYCAENLAPLNRFSGSADDYGARPYFMKLVSPKRVNDDNLTNRRGYRTMSFWRYLAQVEMSSRAPGDAKRPTFYGEDESFLYLARLLKTPMKGGDEDLTSLRWLDKFLKQDSAFGGGLYKQFPEFLTTYADQNYHHRLSKPPVFLDAILGPIETTNVVGPGRVAKQTITIPPVAGERVMVKLQSDFPVVASAKVYPNNGSTSTELNCKNIQIGLLGRDQQQRPGVVNSLSKGGGVATWTLILPKGESTLLVTNSAPKTKDNKELRVELSFFQGALSSKSPAGIIDGVIGPDITYRPSKTLLSFNHPKEYMVASKVQAYSDAQAAKLFSPRFEQGSSSQAQLEDFQPGVAGVDDSLKFAGVPHIEIPGLKPDEIGSFDNAIITHRHRDFGKLQTLRLKESTQQRVGAGRVVITEHTPLYIRGSFSGILRDRRMNEKGSTSGEFFIPLPLLKRDDVEQQGDHISALNQAHFLARTRQTGKVDIQNRNPDLDVPQSDEGEKASEAPSAGVTAAASSQGLTQRERLLERYRTLMKRLGASPKEIEQQMEMMNEMSTEELQQALRFMEGSMK